MRKITLLFVAMLLLLSAIFIFAVYKRNFTGNVIIDRYSYTKAICNETNYCQDYEIACKENETLYIKPITGAAVQQPKNWKDSRSENMRNKEC